jgi:hypothetical protein
MTWMQAAPVIVVGAIFDAVRIFFEWFWFFGPAVGALYCTAKVSGTIGTSLGGTLCGGLASVAGYFGSPALVAFGTVMAIAVGLLGWMVVGLFLLVKNPRIFKENAGHALWFITSLAISEVPILGSAPALSVILWKMYATQIKKDKVVLKQYNEQHAAQLLQERNEQAQTAQFMQIRAAQSAQLEEQEAESEAAYAEAAEDEENNEAAREGEIPE